MESIFWGLLVVGFWLFSGIDGRFGWKPIPSEARVTRDEVSGFINHGVTAVWKTVPPRAKHPRQSYKSVFEKKLSGETNTDYKN